MQIAEIIDEGVKSKMAAAGVAGLIAGANLPDAPNDSTIPDPLPLDSYYWTDPDWEDRDRGSSTLQKPMTRERLYDIARQMGINSNTLNTKKVGFIAIEINGMKVPTKLLTLAELRQIENAKTVRGWMDGDTDENLQEITKLAGLN